MHRQPPFAAETAPTAPCGAGEPGQHQDGGRDPGPLATRVASWRSRLSEVDVDRLDEGESLAALHEIELLTRTLSAVATRLQVAFYTSEVARQIEDGVAPSRAGKAVPDDLALARMTSPYWGSRHLTSAKALVLEMPRTLAALAEGTISDFQARAAAEATACLSPQDRAEVDSRLAIALHGASTREIVAAARALVYEVDPKGYVDRARKAAEDRGLTIRPCPDVMGLLTARLPAPQAIACYQALKKHATAMNAAGDPRTVQQLMADECYARLSGRSVVDGIDVEVGLVITDAALFGGSSDAADLTGFGPIPAETARDLLRPPAGDGAGTVTTADPDPSAGTAQAASTSPEHAAGGRVADACPDGDRCTSFACSQLHGTPPPVATRSSAAAPPASGSRHCPTVDLSAATVWVRRLFTDPATGRLLARDSRRRLFTGALRDLVIARDRSCRNAWCGAPVRHVDHIQRFADDGATDRDNGQGLCARCNLAREHPRHLHPPAESYRPPPPLLPVFLRAS